MWLLDYSAVGFITILLASLLFFAECLVKTKGVFGLIGAFLFTIYFVHHLPGQSPMAMLLLLFIGFLCVIIDGKLINNGSVALIGLVLMLLSCALPAPSLTYGVMVALAFMIGTFSSLWFLKVFPPREYWFKIALMDQLTSEKGYDSMNQEYKSLVGKRGKTLTPCRPVGNIDIEGKSYSAMADGIWVEPNTEVEVLSVDGTKIVIKPLRSQKAEG
ncbi:MAG: NfeD family protein [Tuberibacillus sp.]